MISRIKKIAGCATLVGAVIIIGTTYHIAQMMRHADLYNEMHATLWRYQKGHGGSMPQDLRELVDFATTEGLRLRSLGRPNDWTNFAYVSGWKMGDPWGTPAVVDMPSSLRLGFGMVGYYGGMVRWFPRSRLDRVRENPSAEVRRAFTNQEEFMEFRSRINGTGAPGPDPQIAN